MNIDILICVFSLLASFVAGRAFASLEWGGKYKIALDRSEKNYSRAQFYLKVCRTRGRQLERVGEDPFNWSSAVTWAGDMVNDTMTKRQRDRADAAARGEVT